MDRVEIGEEFEEDGYIWLKLSEDKCAVIWDPEANDWKKPVKLDS